MNTAQVPFSSIKRCSFGENPRIIGWCNLYDSSFGDNCLIGPFVEIGGAKIGNRTYVSSHSYICPGVEIGDDCFIAHGVMFTNDIFSDSPEWKSPVGASFVKRETTIGNRVRIGSGAVILPVFIGDDCVIGAGAVVTKDMPAGSTWAGNPAKLLPSKI